MLFREDKLLNKIQKEQIYKNRIKWIMGHQINKKQSNMQNGDLLEELMNTESLKKFPCAVMLMSLASLEQEFNCISNFFGALLLCFLLCS